MRLLVRLATLGVMFVLAMIVLVQVSDLGARGAGVHPAGRSARAARLPAYDDLQSVTERDLLNITEPRQRKEYVIEVSFNSPASTYDDL